MNRNIIVTNGGGTIHMATTNMTMTLTGSASGSGVLEVSQGVLVVSNTGAANSFAPSAIKLDVGSTLKLAANNQIGDNTGLILNGGTLITGDASAGYSDVMGTLTLSESSIIDLGSFSGELRTLQFADSSAITWNPSAILTIKNWQGDVMTPSDVTEILFGVGGLTSTQLAQIRFENQGLYGGALIGNNGELVPVPEPKVYWVLGGMLGVVGAYEVKRHLSKKKRRREKSVNT